VDWCGAGAKAEHADMDRNAARARNNLVVVLLKEECIIFFEIRFEWQLLVAAVCECLILYSVTVVKCAEL